MGVKLFIRQVSLFLLNKSEIDRGGTQCSRDSNDNLMIVEIHKNAKCFVKICTQLINLLFQSHWIGKGYYRRGPNGNDIHKTNVPHIRLEFRDTVRI